MAVANITYELRDDAGNPVTKTISIDSDNLSMGFLEDLEAAQETGKLRALMQAYETLLGLTHAEARQLTQRQFREIAEALRMASEQAQSIPNA